ncbi:MAG: hypothetical protein U1E97_04720 [Alphaproteobacteria bacterium]
MAIVVAKDGHNAGQIQEQLRASLASFAVPSRWRFQAEPLPVNHAGKVDKAALIAQVHGTRAR